jgi:anaerobic magnesium-protoporphyrin IX monomethyl ester cyclase
MKILLVNPPRFNGRPVVREDRCETTVENVATPMGLVILAGILEKKHQVALIDANGFNLSWSYIEKKMSDFKPDFVVFKAAPETFFSDIRIAKISKKNASKTKTILVCWSLTKVPDQVFKNCKELDYYILDSNYETPIVQLCEGFNASVIPGCAYKVGEDGFKVNLPDGSKFDFASVPMPAWHLIPDFSVYWVQTPSISPHAYVESAKGCGSACSFCTIANLPPLFRRPKQVADEIEYLFKERGVKYINFFDATFNVSRKRTFELCKELMRRDLKGLKWFANIRSDRFSDEEAAVMKASGCEGVAVGIESGSQKVLNLAHKGQTVKQALETIASLKKAGIKQYLSFIVGLPGENLSTLQETKQFIKAVKPTGFQVNSLLPYPRSPIYDYAVKLGKLDSELRPDRLHLYDTPLSLCDLTTDEINKARTEIYNQVYYDYSWWLSNAKWVLSHPSDLKMGFEYAIKVLRRVAGGNSGKPFFT